jgi:hypothetical protein
MCLVSDDQLGALIMCLRRARVMGLLDNSKSESSECLYGIVKIQLVKQALSHTDDQVRNISNFEKSNFHLVH